MARHVLWADGASRGNPGPAGAAYVLVDPAGGQVAADGRYLGTVTNNVAEYEAVVAGLAAAKDLGVSELEVRLDSELVVRQLNGEYRVKDEKLQPLHREAARLLSSFDSTAVAHVPREENRAADALANEAIDAEVGTRARDARAARDEAEGAGESYELRVGMHFDAAHALHGYPGECRELHGHTWEVEVTVVGSELDDVGIVYDFKRLMSDVEHVLGPYDHNFLNEVPPFDRLNPTAEHLAREIFDALSARVGEGVEVREVAVWESPTARIAFRRV
jgi:queuosine biosynthesis protein QueD